MTPEELEMCITKGMIHLHRQWPGWWRNIDATTIDMSDPRWNVLAIAAGCMFYETWQFNTWSMKDLVECGFMPLDGESSFNQLTAEWRRQIDQKQRARY